MSDEFISREFPMRDQDFDALASVAYQATGIVLGTHKRNLVYARISRRIRLLHLKDFAQYVTHLEDHPEELNHFVNAITTNLTSFFRESHHFKQLEEEIFPAIAQTGKRRLRIWSAGCSTGEEPYSLAYTLHKSRDLFRGWDCKILATDLDSNVLNHGKVGLYDRDRVDTLPEDFKSQFFDLQHDGRYLVKPLYRNYITFNRLNLLSDWPMKGQFDVIMCRNVVIYFDKPTQSTLFDRYTEKLNDPGYLIIGHSENLNKSASRFISIGRTVYKKR